MYFQRFASITINVILIFSLLGIATPAYAADDLYTVELKAWIPQPTAEVFTSPLQTCLPAIPGTKWVFAGDNHVGYGGTFRAVARYSFRWNGSRIADVSVEQVFGTSHATQMNIDGRACSMSKTATKSTSITANGNSFQMEIDTGNPFYLSPPEPPINSILNATFVGPDHLAVDLHTDKFPSHGFSIIKNGKPLATVVDFDASCKNTTGLEGMKTVGAGLSSFEHRGHHDIDLRVIGQTWFGPCGQLRPAPLSYPAPANSVPTPVPQPLSYTWGQTGLAFYSNSSKQTALPNLDSLQPGQSAFVVISARNTGTATWNSDSSFPVRLGTTSPTDRTSPLATTGWINQTRPAALRPSTVPPGATATFEFPIRVPSAISGGTWNECYRAVAEGLTWLNGPAVCFNAHALSYQWKPVSQAAYSARGGNVLDLGHLRPRQTGWLVVKAQNTGSATWQQNGANPVLLGTVRPTDRISPFATDAWVANNRPARMLEMSVPPGGIGTFEFPIRAPLAAGNYVEAYSLVANGLDWMNDPGLTFSMHVVPVVGVATVPGNTSGHWLVASDGGIFAYTGAPYLGSMGGSPLNKPVVGMTATPTGKGYWLVAADGGVFAFGDAGYYGSMTDKPLNKPVVGMAATSTGKGYWLVAADGGLFAYGNAPFFGSVADTTLSSSVVGLLVAPFGSSYALITSHGDVFAFEKALPPPPEFPPPSTSQKPQGSYSDWSLPGDDYYNLDTPIFPANDPHAEAGQVQQAYFYSSQFGFTDGGGGYIGIQTDQHGKRAVFSIWDADQARCSDTPGAICRPFDNEGVGYQTIVPYPWLAGHTYRTRVWALDKDSSGEWWLGVIIDDTLGTETVVGSIHVPIGRGHLSGSVYTWVEWYAPGVSDCQQVPISVVFFGPPRANAGGIGAGSPMHHYGSGTCSSSISDYGEWARHRNGWGSEVPPNLEQNHRTYMPLVLR